MTRLKQAWLALCGKLEPEVREVEVVREQMILGTPEEVTLYEVIKREHRVYSCGYDSVIARYLTCEQAHAEHPSRIVQAKRYWRIGSTYLSGLRVEHVTVEPKPKIAKGKRRNG
jgi:hypothetical protein